MTRNVYFENIPDKSLLSSGALFAVNNYIRCKNSNSTAFYIDSFPDIEIVKDFVYFMRIAEIKNFMIPDHILDVSVSMSRNLLHELRKFEVELLGKKSIYTTNPKSEIIGMWLKI